MAVHTKEIAEEIIRRFNIRNLENKKFAKGVLDNAVILIRQHLEQGESVCLTNLCTLYWEDRKPTRKKLPTGQVINLPRRRVLEMRPARGLKGGKPMEKYGVELDTNNIKEAQKGDTDGCSHHCPKCGRQLPHDMNPPICSVCGTEPFEKKLEGK